MRVVITGASGFVGAHLVLGLSGAGYDVVAVGGSRDCPERVKLAASHTGNGDLANLAACERLVREHEPDIVIHAAAIADMAHCEEDPSAASRSNVDATANLLVATRSRRCGVVVISTDLVFDGCSAPRRPFTEDDTPLPRSVYAQTKRQAEHLAFAEFPRAIVLRICLAYGPPVGEITGPLGWLYHAIIGGEAVNLFTDEWRTPLYIADLSLVANTLVERFGATRSWPLPLLHVSGRSRVNRFDFGCLLANEFGRDVSNIRAATRSMYPGRVHRPEDVSLSHARLTELLGIQPRGVNDGLQALRCVLHEGM